MAGGQQYIIDSLSAPSLRGMHVVASAPAGWYVVGGNARRWFDGRTWTDHYAPATPGRPERTAPHHGFHLIMTIMTLGTWLPVWAGVSIAAGVRRLSASSRRKRATVTA